MHTVHTIPGSRWLKFDFHTHTPGSSDFKNEATPEEWIKSAMDHCVDCVVISDHNFAKRIDEIKSCYAKIESLNPRPVWYRKLTIFPGAEVTVLGNTDHVHLLDILA
jgi:histidinol phosphatase-like PHP family hydrolase